MKGKLHCEHLTEGTMDMAFMLVIQGIENSVGFELEIVSGARCPACNDMVDGATKSAHLVSTDHPKCNAVDIKTDNSTQRYKIIKAALLRGIYRIGIGRTFVHLDTESDNPQNVMWDYYKN